MKIKVTLVEASHDDVGKPRVWMSPNLVDEAPKREVHELGIADIGHANRSLDFHEMRWGPSHRATRATSGVLLPAANQEESCQASAEECAATEQGRL